MALTVGVATVLDSREVVVVVTGQRKALALSKAIEEGVNHLVRSISTLPLFSCLTFISGRSLPFNFTHGPSSSLMKMQQLVIFYARSH